MLGWLATVKTGIDLAPKGWALGAALLKRLRGRQLTNAQKIAARKK